jgi:biotin carboxyl carrier protein
MKVILREVSVLLEQFQRSEWKDLHLRTARYSLFLAKPGGAANPMLDGRLVAGMDGAAADAWATVAAPHLATLRSLLPVGSNVQHGAIVGQLEVLGVAEDLVSPAAGVIAEVLAHPGSLVEFETPLLRISPPPSPG